MKVILATAVLLAAFGSGCPSRQLDLADDGGVVAGGGADAADQSGQPTMLAAKQWAQALAIQGTSLYWTTQLGEVRTASLSGDGLTTLVTGETRPWALAADATSLYWIDMDASDAGRLRKSSLSGENVTTLVTGNLWPISIALDESSVYWATNDGLVMKASLDGQNPTRLATGHHPLAIVVRDSDVYFLDDAALFRVSKTGGAVTRLADGQAGADWLAVDAHSLYWVNSTGGSVMKIDRSGQGLTAIASGLPIGQLGPVQVAVDESGVYWTNGMGTVERASGGGLDRTVIASGQTFPESIVLDPSGIYFTNDGSGASGEGSILKLPK